MGDELTREERNRRWHREAGQALSKGKTDPMQLDRQAQRVRVLIDEEQQRLAAEGQQQRSAPMPNACYWSEKKGMWMLREQPPAPSVKWHCTDDGMCHTGCECCFKSTYTDRDGVERQCGWSSGDSSSAYFCSILGRVAATRWFPGTHYVCRVELMRRALACGDHR